MPTEILPEITAPALLNYRRAEVVVCFRPNDEWGMLCNLAPGHPLKVNGLVIRTGEALYQALKFSRHPRLQEKILAQTSAEAADQLARDNRLLVPADFHRLRAAVMWWVIRVRQAAHPSLGGLLAATGTRPIVKLRCDDLFWGAAPLGEDWLRGQNAHGRLLVRLRELSRENGAEWARSVEAPPAVLGLRLFGRELGAFTGPESPVMAAAGNGPPAPGSSSPFGAVGSLLAAALPA